MCDQDDVWREDKISRAVECLSRCPRAVPALYCSRLAVVDENLKPLGYSGVPKRGLSFRNALVENRATGCTILLNQAARRLLQREFPQQVVAHDWWIYLVISAFGTIVYDEEPRILYRKHVANVFGIALGLRDRWNDKIRHVLKPGRWFTATQLMKQVEEFNRIYDPSLPDEPQRILKRFLESRKRLRDRLWYALSCDVYCQSTLDHLILKARIAFDQL